MNTDTLYCIFDYLSYQELCQLRLISKSWKQLVKRFINFKSSTYINSLPRYENIEKKIVSTLKKKNLEMFDSKSLKVHEYNLVIDHGYNGGFFGPSQQIFITINFTYYHNGRFHQVKVFELFSDDLSASGEEEVRHVQYRVPGFQLSLTEKYEYSFFENKIVGEKKFQKLPRWMGFRPSEKFHKMFFILWSTCTANDKFEMELQVLDTAQEAIRVDSYYEGNREKVTNFKSKCEEWLNNLEASLDLSEIENIKDKVTKYVKQIIDDVKKGKKKTNH